MLIINPTLYERLAELLSEAIDSKSFYSGDIYFEDLEADYCFSATLLIYYREEHYPEGYDTVIDNIASVWWEFHSTTEDGEVINNFDFKLLKKFICR